MSDFFLEPMSSWERRWKTQERVGQRWVKKAALEDVSALEARRWAVVSNVIGCVARRKAAFHKLKAAGGGHAVVKSADERGRYHERWKLYLLVGDDFDYEPVGPPRTPKNLDLGMEFQLADARFGRALVRLSIFTDVLVHAIQTAANSDRRKLFPSEGVVNYVINGRDYIFLKETRPYMTTDGNLKVRLKFICGPGPFVEAPYEEIDLSMKSPRKNTLRVGRAYSPEEIVPIIGKSKPIFLDGDRVGLGGLRLHTFKEKGLSCVKCGLKGVRFYKEKEQRTARRWTLNLYGIGPSGNEILMTKDHIIPRSKGGMDRLINLQTMCVRCNLRKADTVGGTNGKHHEAHPDAGTAPGREDDGAAAGDDRASSRRDRRDVPGAAG